jgi:hypothetical protein
MAFRVLASVLSFQSPARAIVSAPPVFYRQRRPTASGLIADPDYPPTGARRLAGASPARARSPIVAIEPELLFQNVFEREP